MASSLLVMANEVIYTIGARSDLLTLAKTWVNRSYQRLQDTIEFPESHVVTTFNTSATVNSYSAPADFFSIISLRNNEIERRMSQVSVPGYERLSLLQSGSPTVYALRGRSAILVWKVPDAIEELQLNYRKNLTPLSADGDLHVLPGAWEEAIVYGATSYAFEYLNEIERARQARASMRATIGQLSDRLVLDLSDRDEPLAPIGLQTGVVS